MFGLRPCWRAQSPDGDRGRQRERGDHKAEVDPCPIPLGSPGRHEKMDHNPQTHGEPQSKPNQIARGLVYGRKAFALRTGIRAVDGMVGFIADVVIRSRS